MQSRLILAAIAICLIGMVLALFMLFRGGADDRLPAVSGSITLKRKGVTPAAAKGKFAGNKVEYVGEPVESAKVSFMQGNVEVGSGVTDATGRFRVKSPVEGEDRMKDGIRPGAYQIKITKMQLVADPTAVTGTPAPKGTPPKLTLPAKYADPEKSGLTAVVVEPPAEQDPAQPPPNFFPFVLEE